MKIIRSRKRALYNKKTCNRIWADVLLSNDETQVRVFNDYVVISARDAQGKGTSIYLTSRELDRLIAARANPTMAHTL